MNKEVRLRDLLKKTVFEAWIDTIDDDQPTTIDATIDAFVRMRSELIKEDEVVALMRAQQRGLRDHHALTRKATRELAPMLVAPRRIELLPEALMFVASLDVLPRHTRLMVSNVSVGVAAGLAYALRPSDIFGLRHGENFEFEVKNRLQCAAPGAVPQSPSVIRLAAHRAKIRDALGAVRSGQIMVNDAGKRLGNAECTQALLRTHEHFELTSFPWQRLRDFVAVRMLRADPDCVPTVADLLEIKNPALVILRYRAFLPRE